MNCKNCNSPVNNDQKFCRICGTKIEPDSPVQAEANTPCDSTAASQPTNPQEEVNTPCDSTAASQPTNPQEEVNTPCDSTTVSQPTNSQEEVNTACDNTAASQPTDSQEEVNTPCDNTAASQPTNSQEEVNTACDSTTAFQPTDSQEYVSETATVNQNANFVNPVQPNMFYAESMPSAAPVKKKSKKKIIIIVTAVVVVLAIALWLLFPTLRRIFMPANQYLQMVETDSIKEASDSVGSLINKVKYAPNESLAADGSISLKLSDKATELLDSESGDISWLSDAQIDFSENKKDNLIQYNMNLKLNSKDIISSSTTFDYDNEVYYINIPELSDKTLKFDLNQDSLGSQSYSDSIAFIKEIYNIIPDGDAAKNIINRYITSAVKQINNVEKTDTVAEVNGVSQKCTLLTAIIDGETAKNICSETLKNLKNDNDIKNIIQNACSIEDTSADFDTVYNNFTTAIDNTLDKINSEDLSTFKNLTYKVWVDYSDNIIGRGIVYEGQDIHYLETENNGQFGYEFDAGTVSIKGNGTKNNGAINGRFNLYVGGINYLILDIENGRFDNILSEEISGTYVFSLPEGIVSKLSDSMYLYGDDDIYSLISGLKLKLDIDSNEEKCDFNLSVLSDNDNFASVETHLKMKTPEAISVPDESNVIDATDSTAMQNWTDQSKAEAIMKRLEDAGVPTVFSSQNRNSISINDIDEYDSLYDSLYR